jgi:hypothetical protein
MAVLLVSRLQAAHFTTFIILIPLFLLLGCCMCGVCCGLCALASVDTNQLDGSENGSDDPTSRMMPSEHYTPPPVVVGDDIESQGSQRLDSAEYGTFHATSYTATSPMIVETALSANSPPKSKVLEPQEVEVDID